MSRIDHAEDAQPNRLTGDHWAKALGVARHEMPSVAAELMCGLLAALPVRPTEMEVSKDKSLVNPTAKAVAPLVA